MTHVIGRDLCAIDTFATACGVEEQEVRGWVQNGTLPSVKLGDQRFINVSRLQADLLSGKDAFDAGDYDHDQHWPNPGCCKRYRLHRPDRSGRTVLG